MSASLVGSEMCIRDRTRRTTRRRPGPWRMFRRIPQTAHARDAAGRTLLAVSYTHLTLPTICSV
eukprot:11871218-Alexandrium_andersonii.AAC.1